MATTLHVPLLEPATQSFVDALAAVGGPPLYELTPDAARDVLTNAQSIPVDKPAASIEDTVFPVGPTGSGQIRIVRPIRVKVPYAVELMPHWHPEDRVYTVSVESIAQADVEIPLRRRQTGGLSARRSHHSPRQHVSFPLGQVQYLHYTGDGDRASRT